MKKHYSSQEKRKRIYSIVGAASGNLVEWFDFYIYAVFATYFKSALTPSDMDETTQSIYVWGIFAASFFMRPIGSWLFGWMADKYGRRQSMVVSIFLMSVSSFMLAFLPTYAQVGLLSPILLLVVRLLQGLSVGGEYGAVSAYMSEMALKGHRGFYASFQYVTLSGGQLLASLLGVILLAFLSEQQLSEGGWRIPFAIGGVVALFSLFIRRTLEETTTEADRHQQESGSISALMRKHWRAFITVIGYTTGGSLSFYTITVYSKTYLTGLGINSHTVGYIMTFALFIFMLSQPLFGALSDRIGRKACMMLFSGLGMLFIYPVFAIGMPLFRDSPVIITLLLLFMLMILSFYTSIGGLVRSEMFPTEVRALGVGFSYAIGNAIFGGSAPSVALTFKKFGVEDLFYLYVIVMLLISFLFSLSLPKKPRYLHNDD